MNGRLRSVYGWTLWLGMACLVTPVAAGDPNDLENGFLITHAPSDYSYTLDACEGYYSAGWGIEDFDEQVTTMPVSSDPALFYVVAAWAEEKAFCGIQFGIDESFAGHFYFTGFGSCLEDHLELSSEAWPGPGEGTAIVSTTGPWEGNFFPVYHFLGYAYEEDTIALGGHPLTGIAEFGNCDMPTLTWPAVCLGAMGVGTPGWYCGPFYPQLAACCFASGECLFLSEPDCQQMGGDWLGPGTSCNPNPCGLTPASPGSWGRIKALYR